MLRFADRSTAAGGKQHASMPGLGKGDAGDVSFTMQLYERNEAIDTAHRVLTPSAASEVLDTPIEEILADTHTVEVKVYSSMIHHLKVSTVLRG